MHRSLAGDTATSDAKLAHRRMLRALHAHLTPREIPSGSVVPAMPRYAHCLVGCRLDGAVWRAFCDTVADLACCGGVAGDAGDDARCLASTTGFGGTVASLASIAMAVVEAMKIENFEFVTCWDVFRISLLLFK